MLAAGCTGSTSGPATARLELSNDTAAARVEPVLADGTSLRMKVLAVYLLPVMDPSVTEVPPSPMIWLNPQCMGDISGCNVDGFTLPAGPRITDYFDLARPSDQVNADLEAQDNPVEPGTYRAVSVELCKALGDETMATVPTMMWKGPGMADEQPFTDGSCGSTSVAFDPPLALADGDTVAVDLGYDLSKAVVSGAPEPDPGSVGCTLSLAGDPHCYRACVDVSSSRRVCMDAPSFAPTASKL